MHFIRKMAKFYKDLPVKIKLMLFVCCFSGWLVVIGALGVWSARSISAGLGKSVNTVRQVTLCNGLKNDFLYLRLDLVYSLIHSAPTRFESAIRDAEQRIKTISGGIDALSARKLDKDEKALLQQFSAGFNAYREQALKLIDKSRAAFTSGDAKARAEAVRFSIDVVAPLFQDPGDAITELVEHNGMVSAAMYKKEMAEYGRLVKVIIVAAGLAVTLGVLFGWIIVRSIVSPLGKTLLAVNAVTAGDLTVTVPVEADDEMGRLAEGINEMVAQTGLVVAYLSQNSLRVEEAANQLYSNSKQIATGAEEVAAQVGTVAVAAEQMSATSNDIAANCQNASQRAERVNASATAGGAVVEGTTHIMATIAEQVRSTAQTVGNLGARSDQIGEIVNTIEDIADQTNLLALNAAIEAARAGEQGRGFAVVADEVRRLAERTTKATKEISALIHDVQSETYKVVGAMRDGVLQVENGTAEAAKSGEALHEILEQIDELNNQVNTIATAAEEQSATTAEITNNIHQVNQVVSSSIKQSHSSTEAAFNLTSLAKELHSLVGRFKVGTAENTATASMARTDHMVFVERIAKAVKGEMSLQSDTLPDHRHCRFGKWYYDAGARYCGHLTAYRDIEQPHVLIHQLAKQAVTAKEHGAQAEAEQILEKLRGASRNIDTLLEELVKQSQ
ncbi:methyl-accepting chemotaxis sensory transducer [Geotalea uraniireducens Rf4]|uniref:Methyl-accepting chemotaxis sensory transducer n=2 Tax=Geotalea uraniireducens TaxID=351604 RepID=A5GCV9_GEOUR|nr:methyl-accepting chemotaxis protein [Geotalea uraniireducens]ABQ24591.1 methyl-accepting chemotaxis sensory transducer [Geotalea uraniireducens Rf4]